jgi:hypothetical protein
MHEATPIDRACSVQRVGRGPRHQWACSMLQAIGNRKQNERGRGCRAGVSAGCRRATSKTSEQLYALCEACVQHFVREASGEVVEG